MADFINENREYLEECLFLNGVKRHMIDDDEIEMWILNDEGLYNWARSEGVDI